MKTFASRLRMRAMHLVLAAGLGALALAGCGGGGGGTSAAAAGGPGRGAGTIATGPNVAPMMVDAGPAGANGVANVPFVSVRVCAPGTSTCQTIDHVIVDTGSSGLRLLASAMSNPSGLPAQTDAASNPVAECTQFVSSYSWGSVRLADVSLANQTAASLPVQIIADPQFPTVPESCASTGTANDSVATLGGNGLLGVGSFLQDCGVACARAAIPGAYYACPKGQACAPTALALASQVAHPVASFPSDNNGVLVQLPAISLDGATNVAGALVLGIGTQANNALGGAHAFGVDNAGNITTVFNGRAYANSFIDSGSDFLFFDTTALPTCTEAGFTAFYCPPTAQALTAVNQGTNGTNGAVNFVVGNARSLFSNRNATAFNDIAATSQGAGGFDWGLPFFFGRNVFMAIEGASTPAGRGPYVAY